MAIDRIGFVGIRTQQFEETLELFRDVIGAKLSRRERELAGFELSDGTILEIYGQAEAFHAFFRTGPVIGFGVDDFDAAKARMLSANVTFIGERQYAGGTSWQHFLCPAGTVAEIVGAGRP
jgi:catechol 2,3-dioxygenase-like lactoylglutathione lyase family enzyme